MRDLLAAERYAQALFELAEAIHSEAVIEKELKNFSEALDQEPNIENVLNNPYFSLERKMGLLAALYGKGKEKHHEVMSDFFSVLLKKGRFHLVREIARAFKRALENQRGVEEVVIRSAVPMEAGSEKSIVSFLQKLSGRKIEVKKEIDGSLLGGVVVKMGNKIFDGSIKSGIANLKKSLLQGVTI